MKMQFYRETLDIYVLKLDFMLKGAWQKTAV